MMARQVARQFCRLEEVHGMVQGRRASGKMTVKRPPALLLMVRSESRLMDYPS